MWKEISGKKLTPKQAHRKLSEYYETRGIVPTVLVVDEVRNFPDILKNIRFGCGGR